MSDDHQPPERRDALREEIASMRKELRAHIEEEMPPVRSMMQELGEPEEVRSRRIFVEMLIKREMKRDELHRALIEKGLLIAIGYLIYFIGNAFWHEIAAVIKQAIGNKP